MKEKQFPESLIYVSDYSDGFNRIKKDDNFLYVDSQGETISNPETIERIQNLVIPPDWNDVWICKNPKGHVQVTGKDSKGRKQYLYHSEWIDYSKQIKYDELKTFGKKLGRIRMQLKKDLRRRKWDKKKVTALAIKLMDELYLRVGNTSYMNENGTYGLTTLRKKHLKEEKKSLLLKYTAKSGKLRKIKISHPTLKKQLKKCSELPGYEIFRYQSGKKYVPIKSQDVNDYLREVSKTNITAKDFRTWGGTVLAVKLEPLAKKICNENPRKKPEPTLVRLVAEQLNNTVAVCRKYYIHPKVLEVAVNENLNDYRPKRPSRSRLYNQNEITVLNILNDKIIS